MQNRSDSVHLGTARRLLALDPSVLGAAGPGATRQFVERLAAVRRDTVFVTVGDAAPQPTVSEPDYRIVDGGKRIVREPGAEEVAGWPPDGTAPAESAALLHLADALLIPRAEICAVAGPGHRDVLEVAGKAVAVGLQRAPQGAVRLGRGEGAHVNRVLQEMQLFLRPARRIGDVCDEAFERALDSLRRNVTEQGFTAASIRDNALRDHDANYAAVWSRDGVLTGLWTLCLDDAEFLQAFRATLENLAAHQSPTGQIPANVRLSGDVEYCGLGGIASIDAVLWFVIGVARYACRARDRAFAERMHDPAELAMRWLAAHDSNNDGLIEIPEASDWMDLFPRSYNVLYDEVLWYQACVDHAALLEGLGRDAAGWRNHAITVKRRILETFWPSGRHFVEKTVGADLQAMHLSGGPYLLCNVTPFDYSWRCDVYGNLLAGLMDLLDEEKSERLFEFLWGVGVNSPYPVRCLYPAVQSGADDWKDYFIVNFLNLPEHYHNGGIWPYIGGLWVRFVYQLGRTELAHQELAALAEACRQGVRGEWEFNEWLHGTTGRPMGKVHQAWSAASYVKAYKTLTEETVPAAFDALDPSRLRAE